MSAKGKTPLRAENAQNRPVARHRHHCYKCGAFLTQDPTHGEREGFGWWTWECQCCGTYQRENDRGEWVASS